MNAPVQATPYAHEAEQSVLGALLLDNGAADRIGELKAKHFYRADHQAIFAEAISLISKGEPADVISIWERLQARGDVFDGELLSYLNQIAQNTPSAANIEHYSGIVVDKALLRGLLHVTGQVEELVRNPRGQSADQILEKVVSMVNSLAARRVRQEPTLINELLVTLIEQIAERSEVGDNAMATGIASLDAQLNGGVRRGQLVIFAGRPSMGKTALAVDVGLNIAERHSALLFSMEMSSQEIAARALANRGGLSLSRILGRIDDADVQAWGAVTHGCSQLNQLRFAIDDTAAISLLELRLRAKAWKRRHGLDLIVVDYIGLMTGGEGEKRHEQIGSYSRGLKALAKELDVTVLALAQLNRKSEDRADRRPQLSDLRDSGEIEQDADVVVLIHRPEMHDPTNDALRGFAEALVRKQRNGALGDIPLKFQGATSRFEEWVGAIPTTTPQKSGWKGGYD
ncbi:replicative DNA helicase [Herbaspirillum frisingense]|uniref:replicative DNA helicase n=1 Tax=Herbaspirillum frisingense TaxID=92645 RepID=UPI001F1F4E5F|nr:replicative DNA helicase [Herbaspirillum frisingense]UIN23518.1 replicative DNA helicase [Herbaspirillum frisingense]